MFRFTILLIILSNTYIANAEETWTVGQAKINNRVVVYKLTNDFPSEDIRNELSWLTVISWKYDGSTRNGMPPVAINEKMIKLEDALETIKGKDALFKLVYTATGNDLKEFVFYISERDIFTNAFNDALAGHERYPIGIVFYQDSNWSDLNELQQNFGIKSRSSD